MPATTYVSYQAPISHIDSFGVPIVNQAAASQITHTGLQSAYSRAYVSNNGSQYAAQQAVSEFLTSHGARNVSFSSGK